MKNTFLITLFTVFTLTTAQPLLCPKSKITYTQESHETRPTGDTSYRLSNLYFTPTNPCALRLSTKDLERISEIPEPPIFKTYLIFDTIGIYAHINQGGVQIHTADFVAATLKVYDKLFPEIWEYFHSVNPSLDRANFRHSQVTALSDTFAMGASAREQYLPFWLHGRNLNSGPKQEYDIGMSGTISAPGPIPLVTNWNYNPKKQIATTLRTAQEGWIRMHPDLVCKELSEKCIFDHLQNGLWGRIQCERRKDGKVIGRQILQLKASP